MKRGFTLVEMMVAISLFTVVMVVSTSTLLALIDANKKAQAMQSVMNNLNVALDGMVRSIRMGTEYHCGSSGFKYVGLDCSSPGDYIAFEAFDGDRDNVNDYVAYYLDNHRIYKEVLDTTGGGRVATPITAQEIKIEKFDVYVRGANHTLYSPLSDSSQPFATIVIKGVAGSSAMSAFSTLGSKKKVETRFHIQAAASQRLLDL